MAGARCCHFLRCHCGGSATKCALSTGSTSTRIACDFLARCLAADQFDVTSPTCQGAVTQLPSCLVHTPLLSFNADRYLCLPITQGEFAKAYATELDSHQVAVKVLKQERRDDPKAVMGLKREIMVMSMMDHPNILSVLAIGHQSDSVPFVVLERLHTVLNKQLPSDPNTVPFWVVWKERHQWPLSRALAVGLQLANALNHCHESAVDGYRVLHRDIKPSNIGFMLPASPSASAGQVVLFDFGLTVLWKRNPNWSADGHPEREEERCLTGECGSLRYMSPEVANSRPYNHLSEVFSFATVLWEVCSHKKPFTSFDEVVFKSAIDKGSRPKVNKKWPLGLCSLLHDCWQHKPKERPEFRDVVLRLQQLVGGLEEDTEDIQASDKHT